MPKVSVIVPNYNHACYLQQRIDSILNQTYQDFELILLDDCSTDHSREILLSYKENPKISRIVFNKQNSGSTFKQWNKGIEMAQGEYIWIAESDDWADITFLEELVSELNKYPDVGIVYTASTLIDEQGNCTYENNESNSGEVLFFKGIDFINNKLLTSNAIWNASMMLFRKELLNNVLNEEYKHMKYSGDWLLYVQLAQKSNIIEIKKTLNHYRKHDKNVSSTAIQAGIFFTEGFKVFRYVATIDGVKISQKTLAQWAKSFAKENIRYSFSSTIKKDILNSFLNYNPILVIYFGYYTIKTRIKLLI